MTIKLILKENNSELYNFTKKLEIGRAQTDLNEFLNQVLVSYQRNDLDLPQKIERLAEEVVAKVKNNEFKEGELDHVMSWLHKHLSNKKTNLFHMDNLFNMFNLVLQGRYEDQGQLEEGFFDFLKRKPKKSGASIPALGQFGGKSGYKPAEPIQRKGAMPSKQRSGSPIPKVGQFGGKNKGSYKNPRGMSASNIQNVNPTFYRNLLNRVAPFFDVQIKNPKEFIQQGGPEEEFLSRELQKLNRMIGKEVGLDLVDLAMKIGRELGSRELEQLSSLSGKEKMDFKSNFIEDILVKTWTSRHDQQQKIKGQQNMFKNLDMAMGNLEENKTIKLKYIKDRK